ncbi:putative peptidyl-trna hydrolase protein [Phaeoacremonium minimum UCRPA7]|uniref:Putative peptidyl-trna hydrolase protein n=1 Tax=Phaeoacremonium minimum (strain UCR-PA7) TaxID=1286976 RepID=R8BJ41_PHAM7|nr:putative peptidyl-trna hydrolase protein [Phaeoacremonium minimum UCRPA7]EON99353.1 putative peptidyl-trna hydrolase protein [Phaeoacremonium minimum UCRPA7]
MRFSTSSVLLALPLFATAQDSPFDQYKAQFQNFLGNFGSYIPNPSRHDHAEAAETKAGAKKMDILTLDNWKETIYAPVKPDATKPEEWWVLITGRNKTCFGHCLKVEAAFNETATKFATLPNAPHVGYVNCDDQPILCNAWSAGAGTLWVFEVLPPPAETDIYLKRLNLTTTDTKTLLDLYAAEDKSSFKKHEGYFHPLDGPLAKNGLAVPIAYLLWGFNAVPSWMMMLGVSFISRTMMSRRMANPDQRRPGAPPAAAAAR